MLDSNKTTMFDSNKTTMFDSNKATMLDSNKTREDTISEQTALFDVVIDYTYALDTLDYYDYERLAA